MHRILRIVGLVAVTSTSALAAQTVNVGTPNTVQPNCFPLGCPSFHNQFEQVYASSLFTGPFDIGALTLYNSIGGGTFGLGTYSIYFSETSFTPSSITGTPGTNITGPETLFATYTSTGSTPPAVFTLTGHEFDYDPSMGNLLLDIRFAPVSFNLSPAHFDVFKSPLVSVVSDESAFAGDDDQKGSGFVTTFTAATPEPGTMAMMAVGLIGMGVPALRRRKRAA